MERNAKEPLHPIEICLGNFTESMGKIEMVTGVMKMDDGTIRIAHLGWHKGTSLLPDDVTYSTYPILLTDEWKLCFGIDKYKLPDWIKFVHQCQNYFMWSLQINILEIMNWDLLPKVVDIEI